MYVNLLQNDSFKIYKLEAEFLDMGAQSYSVQPNIICYRTLFFAEFMRYVKFWRYIMKNSESFLQ